MLSSLRVPSPRFSLGSLPNTDLLQSAARLASEERRITLEVLEHFREIERRKAYSDLGFRSLFDYAVTHLRYSEGSASRRIAAMHALKEHPELREKVQAGSANVTSIARIHTALRREEKISRNKWTALEKKNVFHKMVTLPAKELESSLIALAPQGAVQEKLRPVTSELHELKIHLNAESLKALEELKAAYSGALKNPGSYSEVIQKLITSGMEALLERRKGKVRASTRSGLPSKPQLNPLLDSPLPPMEDLGLEHEIAIDVPRPAQKAEAERRIASPLVGEARRKDLWECSDERGPEGRIQPSKIRVRKPHPQKISRPLRRLLFMRAAYRCEFTDSSGNRCSSKYLLQVEHRTPRALGGSDHPSNLEVLCRAHNQIRGIRVFGPEHMKRGSKRAGSGPLSGAIQEVIQGDVEGSSRTHSGVT